MSFGEFALINNKPRSATIICNEKCDFAILEKKDFKKILKKEEERKLVEEMGVFCKLPLFINLEKVTLKLIYLSSGVKEFRFGENVFEERDEASDMYIVEKGTFLVNNPKRINFLINS